MYSFYLMIFAVFFPENMIAKTKTVKHKSCNEKIKVPISTYSLKKQQQDFSVRLTFILCVISL